nr:hypothetical protein [Streptomyces sp. SLBN-118]
MPVTPDCGHQLVARVHPVGVRDKMRQQFELEVGQIQRPPVHQGGTPLRVDPYGTVALIARLLLRLLIGRYEDGRTSCAPAEDRGERL